MTAQAPACVSGDIDESRSQLLDAMLRILSNPRQLCDGLTRRDLLHIGGLGMLGVNLGNFASLSQARAESQSAAKNFGKAKACILLFPFGSPPQHETFDPKMAERFQDMFVNMAGLATGRPRDKK